MRYRVVSSQNTDRIIICPECKGACTGDKPGPGIGGCNRCMGDGIVEVKNKEQI